MWMKIATLVKELFATDNIRAQVILYLHTYDQKQNNTATPALAGWWTVDTICQLHFQLVMSQEFCFCQFFLGLRWKAAQPLAVWFNCVTSARRLLRHLRSWPCQSRRGLGELACGHDINQRCVASRMSEWHARSTCSSSGRTQSSHRYRHKTNTSSSSCFPDCSDYKADRGQSLFPF